VSDEIEDKIVAQTFYNSTKKLLLLIIYYEKYYKDNTLIL